MFVSRSMTEKVVTIGEDASLLEAREKMSTHRIRHLPVVDETNRLIGIVTDRDLRSAMPYEFSKGTDIEEVREELAAKAVGDIMTTEVMTVSPMDTIQDALLLIQEKRVGAFPVVDEHGYLQGILSVRDLLRAFTNVLGIGSPGTLLGILVEEKVGQLKKIVDAITEENISFGSVLVARYWEEGKRAVFPYIHTNQIATVKRKLTEMGFTLIDPMEWYLDQLPMHEQERD